MTDHNHGIAQLEPGPTRTMTRQHKIESARTGLRASIFLHVDYLPTGEITGIRISEKSKDGSSLDQIFNAIGDEATAAIKFIQHETRTTLAEGVRA